MDKERFILECEGMLCWPTDTTRRDDCDGHLSNQETVDLLNEQDKEIQAQANVIKSYQERNDKLFKKTQELQERNDRQAKRLDNLYKVHNPAVEVKFNKKYYYPIREGVKIQTLRLARKRLDVREGDIVTAVFPGTKDTLKIRITKIGYKQFKSVNLEDAINEGFHEVNDLKNELIKIYPSINQFDRLYYYQFEVIES